MSLNLKPSINERRLELYGNNSNKKMIIGREIVYMSSKQGEWEANAMEHATC
jgi:hypothetical protein